MQSCQAGNGAVRRTPAPSDAPARGDAGTRSGSDRRQEDPWIGLREASLRLGVHANTLRRWADRGWIASGRTAGGHRRFRLAEVEAGGAREAYGSVGPTHSEAPAQAADGPGPVERLSPEQRASLRAMGQRLSALVLRFLARDDTDQRLLADARQIGRAYAGRAIAAGMPLSEAVAAFLFYRSHLVGFLQAGPDALAERYARYDEVVGAVLIGLAQGYESCMAGGRVPADPAAVT